jgi:plasmid maintenance system antidote protein VapI
MTADELNTALRQLGWSQHRLAIEAGMTRNHINRCCRGKYPISSLLAAYVRCVLNAKASGWEAIPRSG